MKKVQNNQKKYLIRILGLIFASEVLLQVNIKIIQLLGMCILPVIFVYGFLFFKNEANEM